MKKIYIIPVLLFTYSSLFSQNFTLNRLNNTFISLPLVFDFDGDQKPDVLGVGRNFSPTGGLQLHLNKSLTDSIIFETTNLGIVALGNPGIGDFDNDGDMDIVVLESENEEILVLINDGTGIFETKAQDTPLAFNFETADLDGDNDVDIVCLNSEEETVFLMINDGVGDFTVVPLAFSFDNAEDVKIGDTDADGDMDIVLGYDKFTDGRVGILINEGDATFKEKTIVSEIFGGLENLQIIDINKDGRIDIAYSNSSSATLAVLLNNGGNNFSKRNVTEAEGDIRSFNIADFDTDGIYDIMIGCNSDKNTFHKGLSRTSFDYDIEEVSGIRPMFYIAAGDFDGDLDLDLIVTNSDFWILTNKLDQFFVNTFDQEIEYAKIYPNPFVDYINVELSAKDMQIVITDLIGNFVFRSNNEHTNIDLQSLEKGYYFISIIDDNSKEIIQTSKIIKIE